LGQAVQIVFPEFSVQLSILDADRLKVEVTSGESAGFSEVVDYVSDQ
jgi:hypothetical protein